MMARSRKDATPKSRMSELMRWMSRGMLYVDGFMITGLLILNDGKVDRKDEALDCRHQSA